MRHLGKLHVYVSDVLKVIGHIRQQPASEKYRDRDVRKEIRIDR